MIYSLQAYRGFAAILVVLYHSHKIMSGYFETSTISEFFLFGHAGVEFFFVLSGFIIYFIHKGDLGHADKVIPYFKKRFVRVYPLYWVVTLIFLPFWLLVPEFGEDFHKQLIPFLKSMLLFPQVHAPHVEVGWTLVFEVCFYCLFGVGIFNRHIGILIFIIWFFFVISALVFSIPYEFPVSFLLSKYNLLFMLGILAAHLQPYVGVDNITKRTAVLLFFTGSSIFLLAGMYEVYLDGRNMTLIYGFGAFLTVLVGPHTALNDFWKTKKTALFFGDASYAIYLIHTMIISFSSKVLVQLGVANFFGGFGIFLLLSVIALLGGALFHVYVEKTILRLVRNAVRNV